MSNKLSQFWQELKRRRVIHVIVVYATAAFVILEAVDIIFPRLNFPDWTVTFVMILLAVGFPIALIFSWIFDVTPEGIEKTKPSKEVRKDERSVTPNSWRIATYVSIVVIIGLIAFNVFRGNNGVRIDESLAKSIAVLPFHNFSGDSNQDFICLGLTDEIISHLYKVESFDEVRSLTSVLNYQDPERNIPLIAEELKVNYILEGSYKRMGDDLKITAQLIEPKNDKHIWLRDYELPYKEVIGIPAEIALQIADHLKAFITDDEQDRINKIPTSYLEAYELVKQARYIFDTSGFVGVPLMLDLALDAIRLDPNYVDAYAWAGIMTLWTGIFRGENEMQHAAMDALPFFEKALELDQNNAIAHNGMGQVNEWARWDYIKAEKEYLKSIDLEPNNSNLYALLVQFFLKMRQLENVLKYKDKSTEQLNMSQSEAKGHILSDNKKKAYKLLAQASRNEMYHPYLGDSYIWFEEYDSAKYYLESALQSGHPEMPIPRFQAALALANEKTNQSQQAQTIVNQLIAKSDTTSVGSPAYFTGWYYSWIGELDSAFSWLEKAFNNHSPEMPWLKVDPAFNSLKDDDRYWDLYERTGHKAYDDYMASKNQ
jgi:TolB-like protein